MNTPLDIERLQIRDERAADATDIGRVTADAFAPMPFGDGTEASLVVALREAGALTISLVATIDHALVGHVGFSPVTLNNQTSNWFQLSPVSVAPHMQGRGIGGALIACGLDRLRDHKAGGCVLTGDPGYYSRFGFRSDPGLTYRGKPNKYLQQIVLSGGSIRGDIGFHPAFGD